MKTLSNINDYIKNLFNLEEFRPEQDIYTLNKMRQEAVFVRNHLCRQNAIRKIDRISIDLFGIRYRERSSFFPENIVLCAAISESYLYNKANVLEIGAFDGIKTAFIARSFDGSNVVFGTFRGG